MAYSTEVTHTQVGSSNTDFAVTFPFLDTTDIKVQLNGVTTSAFTIDQTGATKVVMTTAPSAGDTIRVFRDTNIDAIDATYSAGSSIRSTDLNSNNTQLLYAAQEFGTLKEDNSVSFTLGNKGDIQVNSSSDWVVKDNAIELSMMTDNSVSTNEIVDGSVTSAKLASNIINTGNIAAGSVTEAKLATAAVTTTKIADYNVTNDKIANSTITSAKLAANISFIPVASVIWYGGSTAPTGYLKCNGECIPNGSGTVQGVTADFSTLYGIVGCNLPDLRGEFVRGFDDGKGTDSGRAILSSQTDEFKTHNHTNTATSTVTESAHEHRGRGIEINNTFGGVGITLGTGQSYTVGYDSDSTNWVNNANESVATGITVSTSITIDSTGGTETRPRNIALLACIKY